MKKVNLGLLISSQRAIKKLGEIKGLDAKRLWDTVDFIDLVIKQTEKYNKLREDRVRELGTEVDGRVQIDPNSEAYADFVKFHNELLNTEIEIFDLEFNANELVDFNANELVVLKNIVDIIR